MEESAITRLFQHDAVYGPQDLKFEPFKVDTASVKSFDCGNQSLNEFLCTDEVRNYERELLGKTTLVFCQGKLTGYYTLFNTKLRIEYLKTYKSFSKLGTYHLDGIPSIALGRLAIDKAWQNKGIGRTVFQRIAINTLDGAEQSAIRLIVVQAKKDATDFYEKLAFEYVFETKSEAKRFKTKGTRTMFFDLIVLRTLDQP